MRAGTRIAALAGPLLVLTGVLALWGVASAQQQAAIPVDGYGSFVPGLVRGKAEPLPTVERTTIGHSVRGRPIEAFSIGNGTSTIVLVGGIHNGAEEESVHLVRELLAHFEDHPSELPGDIQLVFVPNVNPDGYAAGTRTNARGVDLNRNWPTVDWKPVAMHGDQEVSGGTAPLSEPETRALHDLLLELDPLFVLSYHGYASLIEDNGVEANGLELAFELTAAYAAATGYEHIRDWPYYEITGQLIDAMEEEGIAAADVELALNDATPFQRNLRGLRATMREAVRIIVEQRQ